MSSIKSELQQALESEDQASIAAISDEMIANQSDDIEYWSVLAMAKAKLSENSSVEVCCRQIIRIDPDNVSGYYNLGLALQQQEKYEEAVAAYSDALSLDSEFHSARLNMSTVLKEMGRLDEAASACRLILDFTPENPQALNNLGLIYRALGELDESRLVLEKLVNIQPRNAQAIYHLGLSYADLSRPILAIQQFQTALALQPNNVKVLTDLGNAKKATGDYVGAIQAYDKAIALDGEYADAHWNRSLVLLVLGRMEEGWAEYEWRWRSGVRRPRQFKRPQWNGEDLNGKRLFVYAEQGLGDSFQFIRLFSILKEMGATTIFEHQPQLTDVVGDIDGIDETVICGERFPAFDYHIALMSVPGRLGLSVANIPAEVPYIHGGVEYPEVKQAIENEPADFRIGIVWAGNPAHTNDMNRSCALEDFEPISKLKGVKLFSLQVGDRATDITNKSSDFFIKDLSPLLENFSATMNAVESLDLIISVDTSVVHLAGAMGKPVWVLLPFVPDWRWLLIRDDSPWYPTARLFRQAPRTPWSALMPVLVEQLESTLARSEHLQ